VSLRHTAWAGEALRAALKQFEGARECASPLLRLQLRILRRGRELINASTIRAADKFKSKPTKIIPLT